MRNLAPPNNRPPMTAQGKGPPIPPSLPGSSSLSQIEPALLTVVG
jgi:hypothetical protein